MNTYDSPGRGRKRCESCGIYVGVRTTDCLCGHVFKPSEKKEVKRSVKTEGGRGLKYCEACENYVGARCHQCPNCGHEFIKGETIKPPVQLTPQEEEAREFLSVMGGGSKLAGNVVLVPSEPCPAKLYGTTEEDVMEFCEFLVAEGKTNNKFYAPSAIRQFVREFHNVNSPEYTEVVNHINNWMTSKGFKND